MNPIRTSAIATAIALAATGAAQAGGVLPPQHTQGSVRYVTGGVGLDEAQAMKKEMPRYALSMEFVGTQGKRGEYLADIPVKIKNRKGVVALDVVSDGPYLLVDLSPGKYAIEASYNGNTERRSVEVQNKGAAHLLFEWKAA